MKRTLKYGFLMAALFLASATCGYAQKTVDKSFVMKNGKGRFSETISVDGEIHSYPFQISGKDSGKTWSLVGRSNPNISIKVMKILDKKMIRITGLPAHPTDWRQKLDKGSYKLLVSVSYAPVYYFFTVELK